MAKTNLGFLAGSFLFVLTTYSQSQPDLKYNYEYSCNKERIVISHCRRDSDQPGFPRTTDAQNFCMVYYPDRPKQGGFTVQKAELQSEVVKNLVACGAVSGGSTGQTTSGGDDSSADGPVAIAAAYVQKGVEYREKGGAFAEDHAVVAFETAVGKYKEIINRDPANVKALTGLGGLYLTHLRKFDLALPIWATLRKLEPKDSTVVMLTAQTLYNLKRYDEAMTVFQQVLAMNPSTDIQALVHVYMNYIYRDQKQYDKAVRENMEAIKIKPDDSSAYHSMGIAYYYLGKRPEAIVAFQNGIRLGYTPAEQAYNWIGYIYNEDRSFDKALTYLLQTYKSNPDYASTSSNLGNAYFGLKRYDEAVAAYKRALELSPNDAQYLYNLGYAYVKIGNKAEALKIYEHLQKMDAAKAKELLLSLSRL